MTKIFKNMHEFSCKIACLNNKEDPVRISKKYSPVIAFVFSIKYLFLVGNPDKEGNVKNMSIFLVLRMCA